MVRSKQSLAGFVYGPLQSNTCLLAWFDCEGGEHEMKNVRTLKGVASSKLPYRHRNEQCDVPEFTGL